MFYKTDLHRLSQIFCSYLANLKMFDFLSFVSPRIRPSYYCAQGEYADFIVLYMQLSASFFFF